MQQCAGVGLLAYVGLVGLSTHVQRQPLSDSLFRWLVMELSCGLSGVSTAPPLSFVREREQHSPSASILEWRKELLEQQTS